MLATKSRAGGAAARAALLRQKDEAPTETAAPAAPAAPTSTATAEPTPSAQPEAPAATAPPATAAQSADTIARLREAKERRRSG
jgi:hypothetical protein